VSDNEKNKKAVLTTTKKIKNKKKRQGTPHSCQLTAKSPRTKPTQAAGMREHNRQIVKKVSNNNCTIHLQLH
jgi:hypothetical protein